MVYRELVFTSHLLPKLNLLESGKSRGKNDYLRFNKDTLILLFVSRHLKTNQIEIRSTEVHLKKVGTER